MEVTSRAFGLLVDRAESAIMDESLELEARIDVRGERIDRASFERLVRYLYATSRVVDAQHDSLDVTQGVYRCTVLDMDAARLMITRNRGLQDVPDEGMTFMRKEVITQRVDLPEYDANVSLKREQHLTESKDALKHLASRTRGATYRLKRRTSFADRTGAFRIDCTAVKQRGGFSPAVLAEVEETYEVEIELVDSAALKPPDDEATAAAAATGAASATQGGAAARTAAKEKERVRALAREVATTVLQAVGEVLQAMRGAESIVPRSVRRGVVDGYLRLLGEVRWKPKGNVVGPQPVTLERANMLPESVDTFSVREGYTVTDKADGVRYLMYFDREGAGWMIDSRATVRATGVSLPARAESVLDGEYVTESRIGEPLDLFLVFDVYFFRGRDVRALPLINFGDATAATRIGLLAEGGAAAAALETARAPVVRVKTFEPRERAAELFQRCVGGGVEYRLDGLILTPAALGVFQNHADTAPDRSARGWRRVFKWKPPEDNSIDFRVQYEKTSVGDVVVSGGKMRATLLVGNSDLSNVDPYAFLTGAAAVSGSELRQFSCERYPGIEGDPGAFLHEVSADARDLPRCEQAPYDTVTDGSIVEFKWVNGRGWAPMRVRYDKDWPNDWRTALGVWCSIAFPVRLSDVVDPTAVHDAGAGSKDDVYFADSAPNEASKMWRRFHRAYVIGNTLLPAAARFSKGVRLMDLACGRGGDLENWMGAGFREVLGVDENEPAVLQAYEKLANYGRRVRNRATDMPRVVFVHGDLTRPLDADAVNATSNVSLRRVAQSVWRFSDVPADPKLRDIVGMGDRPFDVVSCMFAIHYFFESAARLEVFIGHLTRALKPGGVFVGTCMDGAAVHDLLRVAGSLDPDLNREAVSGTDAASGKVSWRIVSDYGDRDFVSGGDNFGMQVLAFIDNINKETPEFLVDFDALTARLARHGIRLLNKGELKDLGVSASSALFSHLHEAVDWRKVAANADGSQSPYDASNAALIGKMTESDKRFSFVNRYFMFVRDGPGANGAKDSATASAATDSIAEAAATATPAGPATAKAATKAKAASEEIESANGSDAAVLATSATVTAAETATAASDVDGKTGAKTRASKKPAAPRKKKAKPDDA